MRKAKLIIKAIGVAAILAIIGAFISPLLEISVGFAIIYYLLKEIWI